MFILSVLTYGCDHGALEYTATGVNMDLEANDETS